MTAADEFAAIVQQLADRGERSLAALWDALGSWGPDDIDRWRLIAEPQIRALARASVDATDAFIQSTLGTSVAVPDLIVDDAAARVADPFDRIGRQMSRGELWPEAVASGGSVARSLGFDSVQRTVRFAMGTVASEGVEWMRRVTGRTCDWCLSLAGERWPTAQAASFGHDRCDCIPMPVSLVEDNNRRILDERGPVPTTSKIRQRSQLKKQVATAKRRQEAARLEQLTERDPVRRERLSIREQEWETRAEMVQDRLSRLSD